MTASGIPGGGSVKAASRRDYLGRTWVDPRQDFRASATQGVGSFALAPIPCEEAVEVIGGVLMDEEEFRVFARKSARYNAIQVDEGLHLVERPEVTEQRAGGSLNHSCDSNLWMADEVTLLARRDIATGEELTVDYALFTVQPGWELDRPCRCGAPNCRGAIKGEDWRLPEVQGRYYPYFSPFINRRIDRLRRLGS